MKQCKQLLVLASFCLSLFFFSCSGEVSASQSTEGLLIPENKTGVVVSNPFKDTTKFEARAITYYSKHDVDYYQISVWYLDGLSEGVETSATNTIDTLKISKNDAYTSKTMVFDNEGSYKFICAAYTADNEMIAEDTVKKTLSFATAEFIIFYLVPKIKSQTADVSASITWSGDDSSATAHTIRFVRPYDKLDTTLTILQNGKCVYDNDAYLPAVEWRNGSSSVMSKIKVSDCDISSMVGKTGDSYSFSLQISPSKTVREENQYSLYNSSVLFTWVRTYSDDNTVTGNTLTQAMYPYRESKGSYWIILDDKIEYVQSYGWEGITFSGNDTLLYKTADEIKAAYYRIDTYGNIITLGDYVETVGDRISYDTNSKNSEYIVGATLYFNNGVEKSVYENTIFDIPNNTVNNSRHSVIFKAVRTPYTF